MSNRKILFLICCMIVIARLSTDIYIPSLPAITNYFQTDQMHAQYTVSFFLFGFSFSQIFYGPLSDTYGRRKIILLGISIFILGSLICILSNSIYALILGRGISGLGIGVSAALKRAIATDLYQNYELVKANTILGNATSVTMLFAPVIGGFIQFYGNWKINFWFIFIYAVIIIAIFLKTLPDTKPAHEKTKFTFQNLHKNYFNVLRDRSFYLNIIYSSCAFTGQVSFTSLSSFIIIKEFSQSVKHYGFFMSITGLSYIISGFFVNYFVQKIGMKNIITYGFMISMFSGLNLLVCFQIGVANISILLFSAVVFVIGSRIVIPCANARSLSSISNLSGYASSLVGIMQSMAGGILGLILAKLTEFNIQSIALVGYSYCILSLIPLIMLYFFDNQKFLAYNLENTTHI